MKLIGYYKDWCLVKKEDNYLVVNKSDKKILCKGNEDQASKYFAMLVAGFINESLRV